MQLPLDLDPKRVLERRQQHLVEVLIARGPRDIGAARDFEVDRLAFLVAREQQEGEDGLEDEQGRGRGGVGADLDGAVLERRGRQAGAEVEHVAADREAVGVGVSGMGEIVEGGDVLGFEAWGWVCELKFRNLWERKIRMFYQGRMSLD